MNFEQEYFQDAYNSEYDVRNPSYKFRSYLSEMKQFVPRGARVLNPTDFSLFFPD